MPRAQRTTKSKKTTAKRRHSSARTRSSLSSGFILSSGFKMSRFLIIVLAVGLVGVVALFYSLAFDSTNGDFEAEAMAVTPTSSNAATSINDNTTGTGLNQFEYGGGTRWMYEQRGDTFSADSHYNRTTNDYYIVRFSGTQVKILTAKDAGLGIQAVSIDGGAETMVDLYSPTRATNQLVYMSSVLAAGNHTLKVRITGSKNPSALYNYIVADQVSVLSSTYPGGVMSDSTASGGRAVRLWSNGNIVKQSTTKVSNRITVFAKGEQCSGAPIMVVKVDGTQVGSFSVAATSYTTYATTINLTAAAHSVDVSFTNDYYASSTCDRNLIVDKIEFAPVTQTTPPLPPPPPTPNTTSASFARVTTTSTASFDQPNNNTGNGAGVTLTADPTGSSQQVWRAFAPSGAGNKYARHYLNVGPYTQSTISRRWVKGLDVWYGYELYLPVGFLNAMQGEVEFMRWDNWANPNPSTGTKEQSGIGIHTDHRLYQTHKRFTYPDSGMLAEYPVYASTSFVPAEGRWMKVSVRQKLNDSDGLAINEFWVDGVKVGSGSTLHNMDSNRVPETLGFGIVSVNSNTQTNALSVYFRNAYIDGYRH
jgi:hypothetical protein